MTRSDRTMARSSKSARPGIQDGKTVMYCEHILLVEKRGDVMIEDFAQDWPAPTGPLPIVLIGAGGIVRDAHLPAYAKAGLTVAAVAEIDKDRRAALAADFAVPDPCQRGRSRGRAWRNSVIYDVAVPPGAIVPILRDLPDGAAVLIQKPMGGDLASAREIRAICRAKRLEAAVNFQLRFSPMMMAARRAVEAEFDRRSAGDRGPSQHLHALDAVPLPFADEAGRNPCPFHPLPRCHPRDLWHPGRPSPGRWVIRARPVSLRPRLPPRSLTGVTCGAG